MTNDPGRLTLWEGLLSSLAVGTPKQSDDPLSERLIKSVQSHIEAEEDSLARYRRLRDESSDPVVRLLIAELLDDEEHHHGMLERMEAELAHELGNARAGEGLPTAHRQAAEPSTIKEVKDLADHEHRGSARMSKLAEESKMVHAGFMSLLVEAMAIDSKKHEMILRFIAKRMEGG